MCSICDSQDYRARYPWTPYHEGRPQPEPDARERDLRDVLFDIADRLAELNDTLTWRPPLAPPTPLRQRQPETNEKPRFEESGGHPS